MTDGLGVVEGLGVALGSGVAKGVAVGTSVRVAVSEGSTATVGSRPCGVGVPQAAVNNKTRISSLRSIRRAPRGQGLRLSIASVRVPQYIL